MANVFDHALRIGLHIFDDIRQQKHHTVSMIASVVDVLASAVRPGRFSHDLLRWASRTAWVPPRPEGCIAGSVAPPDLRCAANDVRGGSYAPRSPCILELSFPWCVGSGGQRACRIRPMSQCRHLAIVARVDSLCAIRTGTPDRLDKAQVCTNIHTAHAANQIHVVSLIWLELEAFLIFHALYTGLV